MILGNANDVNMTYDPLAINIKTYNSEKYLGFNFKPSKNLFEFKNIINDIKVQTTVLFISLKI